MSSTPHVPGSDDAGDDVRSTPAGLTSELAAEIDDVGAELGTPDEDLLRLTSDGPGRIAVAGEIDAHTAPRLDSMIFDEIANGHADVALDMAKVAFVDSSGLRVLIRHRNELHQLGGSLRIVSASPAVEQLLDITGVAELFE